MLIFGTTSEERSIIEDAMSGVIHDIDTAQLILMDELDKNFMDSAQKAISAPEAERIGRTLEAASNMIFNALLEYHLTVADARWRGVPHFLAAAEKVQAAFRTEKAQEKYWETHGGPFLRGERAEKARETLEAIWKLPDEQAAPMLEALTAKNK